MSTGITCFVLFKQIYVLGFRKSAKQKYLLPAYFLVCRTISPNGSLLFFLFEKATQKETVLDRFQIIAQLLAAHPEVLDRSLNIIGRILIMEQHANR